MCVCVCVYVCACVRNSRRAHGCGCGLSRRTSSVDTKSTQTVVQPFVSPQPLAFIHRASSTRSRRRSTRLRSPYPTLDETRGAMQTSSATHRSLHPPMDHPTRLLSVRKPVPLLCMHTCSVCLLRYLSARIVGSHPTAGSRLNTMPPIPPLTLCWTTVQAVVRPTRPHRRRTRVLATRIPRPRPPSPHTRACPLHRLLLSVPPRRPQRRFANARHWKTREAEGIGPEGKGIFANRQEPT